MPCDQRAMRSIQFVVARIERSEIRDIMPRFSDGAVVLAGRTRMSLRSIRATGLCLAMGDSYAKIKVAAVQAASVFLNREASTEKACRLIREAGRNGARVIGFPEGFIPAHPVWYHHHAATGALANRLATELFKNAVEIPGPEIASFSAAARYAQAYVVLGVCEKLPHTTGTMFNTQVYFGPDGSLIGKHQKIMPTVGERLVHTGGFGDTFGAFHTEFGPMSGLICGENSNPLAVFALTAEGTRIHVMSWPNHFPTSGDPMRIRVAIDSQAFAQVSKAFVISACGTVDDDMIRKLKFAPEQETIVRSEAHCGGSVIVAPDLRIIAGPMGGEEGILYADCDLETCVKMKLRHDFAGHYNRPDIFQLHINRAAPHLYRVHNEAARALPGSTADALAEPMKRLVTPDTVPTDNDARAEKPTRED
jgi:nitrilase